MTELQFDPMRDEPPSPPEKRRSSGVWVAAAAIALAVAIGFWLASHKVQPAAPAAAPPVAAAPEPEPGLPALEDSDTFVRALVSEVLASPVLAEWLAGGEDLIQSGVRAVVAISAQRSAHRFLGWLPIDGRFSVRPRGAGWVIAPESYARFDRLVDLFVALDDAAILRLLRRLDPLIAQSMDDNAFPGTEFKPTLAQAIEHLLSTPVPGEELAVNAGEDGVYRFADPMLEALSAPQKQLLRLGASNGARVRAKLASLAHGLAAE